MCYSEKASSFLTDGSILENEKQLVNQEYLQILL